LALALKAQGKLTPPENTAIFCLLHPQSLAASLSLKMVWGYPQISLFQGGVDFEKNMFIELFASTNIMP